jgi:hypothetical protein
MKLSVIAALRRNPGDIQRCNWIAGQARNDKG